MDLLRSLFGSGESRDHARVFERFRLALESVVADRRERPVPRVADILDGRNR